MQMGVGYTFGGMRPRFWILLPGVCGLYMLLISCASQKSSVLISETYHTLRLPKKYVQAFDTGRVRTERGDFLEDQIVFGHDHLQHTLVSSYGRNGFLKLRFCPRGRTILPHYKGVNHTKVFYYKTNPEVLKIDQLPDSSLDVSLKISVYKCFHKAINPPWVKCILYLENRVYWVASDTAIPVASFYRR